jgi:hypothetical protein
VALSTADFCATSHIYVNCRGLLALLEYYVLLDYNDPSKPVFSLGYYSILEKSKFEIALS